MNRQENIKIIKEQEKEIANILSNSSLYLDMSPAEKHKLLHHLVLSYFLNLLPAKNEQAQPAAIRADQ